MNHIAIVREGDNDNISLDNYQFFLRDVKPNFVKWSKKNCTIVFVGMYTIRRNNDSITIYSLPKYFPKEKCNKDNLDEIQNHIKKICRVIEKLRLEGKTFDDEEYLFNPYELRLSKEIVNRVELAEYIIEDYLQNGLYIKQLTETIRGSIGRTNWAKTVAKINPMIQRDTPLYLELMNRHPIIDESDFISIIHANIINQCLEFMGNLISNGIEYVETEALGDDISEFASIISAQSTYVFKEREINLFKSLEAWCSLTKYYENYAGVTCFHKVWEWVNDSVWGNIDHPNSSNPIYHIENNEYFGKGESIPDTIRIEQIPNKKIFETFIFDSKYYTINYINPDNHQIDGFPANSDIVKQMAYLKLIKSQYKSENYYNSFLLPESSEKCKKNEQEWFVIPEKEWFKTIGFVKPGSFNFPNIELKNSSNNEDKIGIILVNPDKLYDRYLNEYHAKYNELLNTITYLSMA